MMGDDWLINQFAMTQQKLVTVVPPPAKDKDKVEPAVVVAARPVDSLNKASDQQLERDAEVLRHPGDRYDARQGRGHLRRRSSISVVTTSAAEWTFDHEAPRTPERQNSIDSIARRSSEQITPPGWLREMERAATPPSPLRTYGEAAVQTVAEFADFAGGLLWDLLLPGRGEKRSRLEQ